VSQQQIGGGGYVEFTPSSTGSLRFVGLGGHSIDPLSMLFSIRLQGTTAEVRESGVYKSETPFAAGDVIRITAGSDVVTYSRNGSVFFTSAGIAAGLFVDVALADVNATIVNVTIGTPPSSAPAASRVPTSPAGGR
jgi:hypothetical protein